MKYYYETQLDRDFYSKSSEIFNYLKVMFNMDYTPWKGHPRTENPPFFVSQNFGYTTIYIRDSDRHIEFNEWIKDRVA